MVGPEQRVYADCPISSLERPVPRYADAGTLFRDRLSTFERSITVDGQTRVTAQHQGCIEMTRQAPRDFRRSRIPGDVIRQFGGLEAKRAQPARYPIGSMIADEHRASRAISVDHLVCRRLVARQQRFGRQVRLVHQAKMPGKAISLTTAA
jgi:hypothetical protein